MPISLPVLPVPEARRVVIQVAVSAATAATTTETAGVQVPNVVLVVLQRWWRLPAVRAADNHAVPDGLLRWQPAALRHLHRHVTANCWCGAAARCKFKLIAYSYVPTSVCLLNSSVDGVLLTCKVACATAVEIQMCFVLSRC
jgi:hypothetical protein